MIFGRKKHTSVDSDAEEAAGATTHTEDPAQSAEERLVDSGLSPDADGSEQQAAARTAPADEWELLDESKDWRTEGPFDITEVDLEADDVERLDFGSLVLTPFDGMQLQLQVNQATQEVQAVLVVQGQSVLELSLFAAPAHHSMLPTIRAEMMENTNSAGGTFTLGKGPFGTEVRRVVPLTTPDGQHGYHVSRTWFAQGPRWLLRGVLMGEAGVSEGIEGPAELLYEFFANTVVRRGERPMVPGDLIPLSLPENLGSQPEAR
ncbi:Protein of unknown function [Propionibacterium cyclohexanicum]|uniref:DUF3710 domain-containing protein n=1 Tax=Propionibacterium cyclohexanicum TaxID=64702 RepID=A0A1H9QP41_9ACTN|nr:DUF3710 domain-containing protein [Propionibacterium cyclohexanicum]SER62218.1 Protein of unknown function [Propionibacterium cyclohexanicum]